MADYDLGTARGKIDIDASGAEFGFGRAARANEGFEKSVSKTTRAARVSGAVVAGAGAAIAAGLGLAVYTAANFEKRMSAVAAVSGASGKELEKLSDLALQLGADTAFSAGEAAGAIEELVKAGLSVEDVLNGAAKATVNLAAAGEVDLATAATIAANAMNAFNLEGKDMEHVADLIAGAANASAIDVGEFGQSLQQAGATANLVGLDFDDLSVAIAAMGNAGIKGSDAGTSLKTFLANLQPTTKKQIDLFKELGLVTEEGANAFFDAQGKIKPMRDIAETLSTALEGMTDQQKALTLETLFGSDAIRAAAIIADQGAEGFDELAASMGKVSAEEVAEKRLDNLAGSIEQLKGSLETLFIRIGTPLLGFIRTFVDGLVELVNWFGELSPGMQKTIGIAAAVTAAFLLIGGSILLLIGWLGSIAGALSLTIGGLAGIIAVTFAVIAAIAALAAGFIYLWNTNETFRNSIKAAWNFIKNTVLGIIDDVRNGIHGLIEAFKGEGITSDGFVGVMERIGVAARAVVDWFTEDFIPAVQWVVDELTERFDSAVSWLEENVFPVFQDLSDQFSAAVRVVSNVLNKLEPLFKGAWKAIQIIVKGAISVITTVIKTGVTIIQTIWTNFGDNIWSTIKTIWDLIVGVITAALQVIRGIIQVFTGILTLDWTTAWNGIKMIFSGVWTFIKTILSAALSFIQIAIETAVDIISTIWQTAWTAIQGAVSVAWTTIKTIVTAGATFIRGYISSVLNFIKAIWNTAWSGIKSFLSTTWEAIKTAVSTAITAVVGFVGGLKDRAYNALAGIVTKLVSRGKELINGLKDGAKSAADVLMIWVIALPGKIVDWIGDLGEKLWDAGVDLIQGFIDGIKSKVEGVKNALGDITSSLTSWKGPPRVDAKILVESGELVMTGFMDGILNQVGPLRRMLQGIAPSLAADLRVDSSAFGQSAASNTDNSINVKVDFHGVTNEAQLRSAMSDKNLLNEITRAVRAGRR